MRPYPMLDEIKMHIRLWMCDDTWRKVPPGVKDALTTALNEIKVRDALVAQGLDDERENTTPVNATKRFIAIYKQKYLEYSDLVCTETIEPSTRVVICELCKKLTDEGADQLMYLNWFFDEFLKNEFNKKRYGMPPTLRSVISNSIYTKFLFEKKQGLKARQQDIANLTVKTAVMGLATEYLEKSKNKEFGKKILEYTEGKTSLSRFSRLFLNLLNEQGETDMAKELEGLMGDSK